jgi:adenine phosphoribosyltransferase
MGLPLIPVRKKGKLPGEVVSRQYELEYGSAQIEIHKSDIPKAGRVLVMDDLAATGGTLRATCELLSANGAVVENIFCVIGLPFLRYQDKLSGYKIQTIINYESE